MNLLARLPKWFGERPGKKPGEPETPEGEEDVKADDDVLDDEDEAEVEEVVEEGNHFILFVLVLFFKDTFFNQNN